MIIFSHFSSGCYTKPLNLVNHSVGSKETRAELHYDSVFLANKGKCKVFKNFNESYILISFNKDFSNGEEYEVFITDSNVKTSFSLSEQLTAGDKILVDNTSLGNQLAYTVQIENINKISNCKGYDTSSKNDCIETAAMEDVGSDLGCLPPWMSDKFACDDNTTKKFSTDDMQVNFLTKVYDVMLGFPIYNGESGCLNACKEQKINIAYSTKMKMDNTKAAVVIKFEDPIKVQLFLLNIIFLIYC